MAKPTWRDLYLAVQGAEVLDAQKSARIAALEAENKLLLAALQTANSYFPKVELLIVEGATLPAPTIRALLNGGGK